MLTGRGLFCSAQSGAIPRFATRGNHHGRDGGIRNCGRRHIADLLRADDAIAAQIADHLATAPDSTAAIMPAATAGASSTGSAATIPHSTVRAIRAIQAEATAGPAAMAAMAVVEATAVAINAARRRTVQHFDLSQ